MASSKLIARITHVIGWAYMLRDEVRLYVKRPDLRRRVREQRRARRNSTPTLFAV